MLAASHDIRHCARYRCTVKRQPSFRSKFVQANLNILSLSVFILGPSSAYKRPTRQSRIQYVQTVGGWHEKDGLSAFRSFPTCGHTTQQLLHECYNCKILWLFDEQNMVQCQTDTLTRTSVSAWVCRVIYPLTGLHNNVSHRYHILQYCIVYTDRRNVWANFHFVQEQKAFTGLLWASAWTGDSAGQYAILLQRTARLKAQRACVCVFTVLCIPNQQPSYIVRSVG